MMLLAVYLILVGLIEIFGLYLSVIPGIIALLAGIFIVLGRQRISRGIRKADAVERSRNSVIPNEVEGSRSVTSKFAQSDSSTSPGMTTICGVRNIATWMRRSDKKYFAPFLSRYPKVKISNAALRKVPFEQMDGLLITGGPEVTR